MMQPLYGSLYGPLYEPLYEPLLRVNYEPFP